MSTLVDALLFFQALGVLIGAYTTVWGELAYIRAMRDGTIDVSERVHLTIIAKGLRFGMSLILLSSCGLVIALYVLHTTFQAALSSNYWISMVLALLIIGVAGALSRHRISFAVGSSIIFTGWWFLLYLILGFLPPLSFGAAVALFVVATAIFYTILTSIHFFALRKN